ncbi:golgin subfamily B member 1 [Sarotherodon galilaeus]
MGARPKFANGQPQWSDTYEPKYSLYSPTTRLRCVCKPGFHYSSDECITCIEGEEHTVAPPLVSQHSDTRTSTPGIISAVCVVLVLLLTCGLSFRYHSVLRVVCVRAGKECRVGISAVNNCITRLVGRLSRPARAPAVVLTVLRDDNVVLDKPNCEGPLSDYDQVPDNVVLDKPNCKGPLSDHDHVRTIGERKIAGVRVTIILYAVTTVTLLGTLIVGTLYATDRLLTTYCDSAISVYTFPLGYTVTSKGVGNLEALALSGFLNRCRKQNEFVVPANIKFHKAIRCLRGSREYKRASGDASQIKLSHSSKGSVSSHAGVSGSMLGVTTLAEVTFSKTDAVERSMERTVSSSNKISVSSSSYQCQVGSATFSSYEPTTALRMSVKELNLDPDGYIDEFLDTWGYGFVSSVEVGGYYSSFEVFSTCNKDAEDSLNDAA